MNLRRVLARLARYERILIDQVAYVPVADLGAEFLFQIIAERAEKAAVILTANLPFSEWTHVIPNARLRKERQHKARLREREISHIGWPVHNDQRGLAELHELGRVECK